MDSHIPIGFRFEPTEEEIIRGFFLPWAIGQPLPWNGIVHRPLYGPDAAPWAVFSDGSGYWQTKKEGGQIKTTTYVFTSLVRIKNRISRTAGGGTWGGQTGPKKIFNSETGDTIGFSRMLSFEHPDSRGASSEYGHWIMHEYVFSKEMLEVIPTAGACDMAVCKITRCFKNSGGSGRKPPQQQQQQPQLQFFPSAIADAQQQFFPLGITEAQPQPQFFPPTGGSDCIQVPSNKRGAEEDCFQGVQENSCKKQKWSGGEGGEVSEVVVEAGGSDYIQIPSNKRGVEEDCFQEVQENSCKKQKWSGGEGGGVSEVVSIPEAEKEDDSLVLSVLEFDEKVAKEDYSWLESVLEFDEGEEKEDDSRIISGLELNEENVAKEDDSRDESASDQEFDDYFDLQSLLGRMDGSDQL